MGVIRSVFVAFLLFLIAGMARAELPPKPDNPSIVVEISNARVLSSQREFERWAPASLTKLMTAYTVFRALELQHLSMNSPVGVTQEALAQPPSKMGFPVGTVMTIESAIKIIMVKSANDISVALAQAVAGTESAFVDRMNAHARQLGMTDTRFTNPHGLHNPEQYTTARDMALLALDLTKRFPQYDNFFDIPAIRITGRRLTNHNRLLRLYDGTNGMKTGYVCASGYNIVVRTEREDRGLIAVVLGGESGFARNVRAAHILETAFSNPLNPEPPAITDITAPEGTSLFPTDITKTICPRKHIPSRVPSSNPQSAELPADAPGIDGLKFANDGKTDAERILPIPEPKPDQPQKLAMASASGDGEKQEEEVEPVPEDRPLSLKELSQLYFKPREDLREDVKVSLNGATGPNPNAVRNTNGGRYEAPIPVPQARPALDLNEPEE